MIKYYQQSFFLNDITFSLIKTDIVLLLILTFIEKIIVGISDVLYIITIWLCLTDEMISNKVVMIWQDLLIIRIAQQFIFWW